MGKKNNSIEKGTAFVVSGPWEIPFKKKKYGNKWISKEIVNSEGFWLENRIGDEIGCYVFAMRAGQGLTPHYVGQTVDSFAQECFGVGKPSKYNEVLSDQKRGTPVMFFVYPKNSRRPPINRIDELETFLIQIAHKVNPNVLNVQKKKTPKWYVSGITGGGRGSGSKSSGDFKRLMNLLK